MQKILHLYRSEKVLILSGLLFVLMVGVVLAFSVGDSELDSDGDTVADSVDRCPNTQIDNPTDSLSVNHHIWVGGKYFTVLVPNKKDKDKVQSEFSMAATKGCSCSDIVIFGNKNIENSSDSKFGCSKGTMEAWISSNRN